ncbi:MAG: hypothetical protein D6734_05625 [Candidatus Schekmanbacteria bacterium]|nr:MAG: hypothetical protein D6734_05625 [Candidatus Schekmanbacteria bacterium]
MNCEGNSFFNDKSLLENFLIISPTYRCNLSCKGCYAKGRDKGHILDENELHRIITESEKKESDFL